MHDPNRPPIVDEPAQEERPKLPPGTDRVLRRMEKLANPTPIEKRLAWFDRRKKKVRKVVREFQALGLPAELEEGDGGEG